MQVPLVEHTYVCHDAFRPECRRKFCTYSIASTDLPFCCGTLRLAAYVSALLFNAQLYNWEGKWNVCNFVSWSLKLIDFKSSRIITVSQQQTITLWKVLSNQIIHYKYQKRHNHATTKLWHYWRTFSSILDRSQYIWTTPSLLFGTLQCKMWCMSFFGDLDHMQSFFICVDALHLYIITSNDF